MWGTTVNMEQSDFHDPNTRAVCRDWPAPQHGEQKGVGEAGDSRFHYFQPELQTSEGARLLAAQLALIQTYKSVSEPLASCEDVPWEDSLYSGSGRDKKEHWLQMARGVSLNKHLTRKYVT